MNIYISNLCIPMKSYGAIVFVVSQTIEKFGQCQNELCKYLLCRDVHCITRIYIYIYTTYSYMINKQIDKYLFGVWHVQCSIPNIHF